MINPRPAARWGVSTGWLVRFLQRRDYRNIVHFRHRHFRTGERLSSPGVEVVVHPLKIQTGKKSPAGQGGKETAVRISAPINTFHFVRHYLRVVVLWGRYMRRQWRIGPHEKYGTQRFILRAGAVEREIVGDGIVTERRLDAHHMHSIHHPFFHHRQLPAFCMAEKRQ